MKEYSIESCEHVQPRKKLRHPPDMLKPKPPASTCDSSNPKQGLGNRMYYNGGRNNY